MMGSIFPQTFAGARLLEQSGLGVFDSRFIGPQFLQPSRRRQRARIWFPRGAHAEWSQSQRRFKNKYLGFARI